MGNITNKLTKLLWNKNYPRTLLIFNINNVSQIASSILVLIFYFMFPVEEPSIWGLVACISLIVVPIIGIVTAVLNQESFEWVVFITHGIIAFILVPLYFCTVGTFYGVGLVMFVLTVAQSYVLIKDVKLKMVIIGLQNTFYCMIMIMAAIYPEFFHNYADGLTLKMPLFTIAVSAMNIYICFLARIFVFTFTMDYERTIELAKSLDTVNSMDDLTGAFNKETGLEILQNLMNSAWKSKSSLSIAAVEVQIPQEMVEDNKYLEDLIIANAFDACRSSISSDSPIARIDENKFLLILPGYTTERQIDSLFVDIDSQFAILMQAANIEEGSLAFGDSTLQNGMTLDKFLESVEKNMQVRRESR